MNIMEVLEDLGIPYALGGSHHHVTSNFVGIDCPRCSPGSASYKYGISTQGQPYQGNCWSCGSYPIAAALTEASTLPHGRVRELLGHLTAKTWQAKPRGKLKLPEGLGELLPIHRKYLASRGLDPDELIRLWGLQGLGIHAHLAWRVFIPIIHQGRTVSWTTRAISEKVGRRYITAPASDEELSIKTVLFGGDYVRHAAIVVEGPFDAMRLGPGAVALCGVNYGQETHSPQPSQLNQLGRIPRRAICFDNEPDAQRRARQLVDTLSVLPGQTRLVQIDAKDPGSASEREVRQLRRTFLE